MFWEIYPKLISLSYVHVVRFIVGFCFEYCYRVVVGEKYYIISWEQKNTITISDFRTMFNIDSRYGITKKKNLNTAQHQFSLRHIVHKSERSPPQKGPFWGICFPNFFSPIFEMMS